MADIPLTQVQGATTLPRLAPDLSYPSDKTSSTQSYKTITVPVTAGVPTVTLSLAGKWDISYIKYENLIAESMDHKLTVDGVVIWNDTGKSATTETLLGAPSFGEHIQCNESFELEITTTTDTSVDILYLARPML